MSCNRATMRATPAQSETQISAAVGKVAEKIPGMVLVRVQSGAARVRGGFMRLAPEGTADRLGAFRGKPLAVEVKKPGGSQSEGQKEFQRRWEAAGGLYWLVESPSDLLGWVVPIAAQAGARVKG